VVRLQAPGWPVQPCSCDGGSHTPFLGVMLRFSRHLAGLFFCALYGLVLPSCDEPQSSGPALFVTDSAGIQVVDFDLDQVPRYGSVDPNAEWIFGKTPARTEGTPLNGVWGAPLFESGRVAVINGTSQEVFILSADGVELAKIGGRGQGPGALDFIMAVFELGDTVGVYDSGYRKWLTYRDGEYVSSLKLPSLGVPGPFFPDVVIPDGDGFVVGDAHAPPGSVGGEVIRRQVLVARVVGETVDTIATIPGETGVDKYTAVSALPWGASYAIERSESGVWLGDSAVPQLALWSRSGELLRIVRWRSKRDRALTRSKINRYRELVTEGRPEEIQKRVRQNFRRTEFPSQIPAWWAVVRGANGVLWISDYPGPASEGPWGSPYPVQTWWGIDTTGNPVGTLTSPAGLKVTGFGRDFLVGIHKDDLGVETVRKHRIEVDSVEIVGR
jgi:hypothetical protein